MNLASIERRRLQIWSVMAFLLLAVSSVVTLASYWPDFSDRTIVDVGTLRLSMVVMSASFVAYVFEKERALRAITRRHVRERELNARLDAEIRRLHGLVEEAQALGAALEDERLLYAVLGCAIDLVSGSGAAVSLVEPDGLQLSQVRGEGANGIVMPGEASQAALERGEVVDVHGGRPGTGALSGVAISMRAGSVVVGVIDVRTADGHELGDLEINALEVLSGHAATAILHARRYERARRTNPMHKDAASMWSELEALAERPSPPAR